MFKLIQSQMREKVILAQNSAVELEAIKRMNAQDYLLFLETCLARK